MQILPSGKVIHDCVHFSIPNVSMCDNPIACVHCCVRTLCVHAAIRQGRDCVPYCVWCALCKGHTRVHYVEVYLNVPVCAYPMCICTCC